MSATTGTPARNLTLPTAPVLVGILYVVGVTVPLLIFAGIILFTDEDPWSSQGPVESIIGIALVGHAALALGAGIAFATRAPERSAAGAIVLAVLSVVTLFFFWSGAPGILGACAAARAGLTRDGQPLRGPARIAGVIGLFMAALNILVTLGAYGMAAISA